MPGGGGSVPLVSTATSKPARVQRVDQRRRRAAAAARRRCRRRSGCACAAAGQCAATRVGERRRRSRTCRRPGRRCRRSRCRRTGRSRVARSSSRPVHRLQPAKRQNTAGRPALRALALQRVEDLLDRVASCRACASAVARSGRRRRPRRSPCGAAGTSRSAPHARAVGVGVVAADASARSRRRARGRARMISALVRSISGVWIVQRAAPSTPALVARFAIRSKARDVLGPAVGIAAVVERVDADEDVARRRAPRPRPARTRGRSCCAPARR